MLPRYISGDVIILNMTERVDENRFKCSVCGFIYEEESIATDCEEWCKAHSSCNVLITEKAVDRDEEDHKL